MKKILLSLILTAFAAGMNAETLADFQRGIGSFEVYGSTTKDFVKINKNANSVAGIKFANSFSTENKLNANYAAVTCDGGFKAGDVLTVAGAFNNSDETKTAAVSFFTKDGEGYNVFFSTEPFINGRTVEADPTGETFTLTEDLDTIFFGRNGNTATFVTTLKVVRGEETPDNPGPEDPDKSDALADYQGGVLAGVFTASGTCSMDESVKIHTDTDAMKGIKFANSYKKDNALTENYVTVTCDGGFLQGDIVKIACVYNNKDEKETRMHVFAVDEEKNIRVLYETELCINGKTNPDTPAVEQFELDGDYETLYLGRQGSTGTFVLTFTVTRPSEEEEGIPGDVNGDEKVDISDVVAIINQMAGAATWDKADVNGDEKVDISDVVAVINLMAGTQSASE